MNSGQTAPRGVVSMSGGHTAPLVLYEVFGSYVGFRVFESYVGFRVFGSYVGLGFLDLMSGATCSGL
jgi:hypothetical protein